MADKPTYVELASDWLWRVVMVGLLAYILGVSPREAWRRWREAERDGR